MSEVVTVFVVSPDTRSERRYDLHLTINQLKTKLESVTGISVDSQSISLYDSESDATPIRVLDNDDKPLGYFGIRNFQVLKVSDSSGHSLAGQFTDVSQVQKFELTEREYAERQDTVLAYKQLHKIGRFAETQAEAGETGSRVAEVDIQIGLRCEVETTDADFKKRGTVRFVGETNFGPRTGNWIGVEYDEPLGKNDGSVQGERYFTCRPLYGAFVRPDKVTVGDFPIEEIDVDEEM